MPQGPIHGPTAQEAVSVGHVREGQLPFRELLQTETAVPLELADELRHGDGKEYSPRTDLHISRLIEVLAYFEYSPDGVASLVRRCQYDDQRIQIAVARIIEDQVSHEQTTWGVV